MKYSSYLLVFLLISVNVWAANSLVSTSDISKMKKAGISQNIINYLLTHQTCSIDANTVIQYHQSGIAEQKIKNLIQTDAYRPERESTVEREFKLIEGLKQAGFSDRAILEYLSSIRSNQIIDLNGNRSYRFLPPVKQNHQTKESSYRSPLIYPTALEITR